MLLALLKVQIGIYQEQDCTVQLHASTALFQLSIRAFFGQHKHSTLLKEIARKYSSTFRHNRKRLSHKLANHHTK